LDNPNQRNWLLSRDKTGWVSLTDAVQATWRKLGFKCGLEIHQQLKTSHKLFCRCPAGIYHDFGDFDAEVVRHMRPTLSELGEYDGTALMEFKTRKKIVYRIKNDSACTYEVDDTPPFPLNREALDHAMQIALLLKMKIVGELHITRKQYLDGSIPTGFQRTAILGIEGEFPISNKTIRVIQFSIEEDSCREVSDFRHTRVYFADRLGMPLIETVTYPDMLTPWEAAEAAQSIRFIARSSGLARTGIGAAREDVNVSVDGGTRIEIKGVAHISWIPKLTHNEAFRQKSLLLIRDELAGRNLDAKAWKISQAMLDPADWRHVDIFKKAGSDGWKLIAVNLPGFAGILSWFNQPGRCFADEIADRLKVIACLEKPNMFHSEEFEYGEEAPRNEGSVYLVEEDWQRVRKELKAGPSDAQVLFWAPEEDIKTALETIQERCQMAFKGVPNETRKSLPDGITIFERVLPGADRMYPDTDSAPISVQEEQITEARAKLPVDLARRFEQLAEWGIPTDAYTYLLRNNLMPVLEELSVKHGIEPKRLGLHYAHLLKSLQGCEPLPFDHQRVEDLLIFIGKRKLQDDIMPEMLKTLYHNPNMQFSSVLSVIGYKETPQQEILEQIPLLKAMWPRAKTRGLKRPDAIQHWMMGRLHKMALGNIHLAELRRAIEKELSTD
jgi:glutamyl-tRNA(Gln) amidotransferase subunit E